MAWAAVAGAAIGVVGSQLGKKGSGGSSQQSSEPWGPAAGLLEGYLDQNKQLNGYYQQNPFNAQQRAGYQNLFNGYDNYAQNVQPGLLAFANDLMGSGYQRQGGSGSGLSGTNPYARSSIGTASQGIPRGLAASPFAAPQQMPYGILNFDAQNPWKNELKPAPAEQAQAPSQQDQYDMFEQWMRQRDPEAYQQWDYSRRYGQGGS